MINDCAPIVADHNIWTLKCLVVLMDLKYDASIFWVAVAWCGVLLTVDLTSNYKPNI